MTLLPVRYTQYDDSDSTRDLCRTRSAAKDPAKGDTEETRAARFTKRVQNGEGKLRRTELRRFIKPKTEIDHARVRRMSWAGLTPRQISDELCVRPGTIRRILQRYSGRVFRRQMEAGDV